MPIHAMHDTTARTEHESAANLHKGSSIRSRKRTNHATRALANHVTYHSALWDNVPLSHSFSVIAGSCRRPLASEPSEIHGHSFTIVR